ncbi:MAG: YebC/PmpR family DNA-binding transcriptional regulator, partial [Gammaproteobacteria bacterium]
LSSNVPKDNIDRALNRAAGGQDRQVIEEVRYEGYGPGGVAVMVDCMTDNRQRTVADVRHAFAKCGGNLGTDGSVAYLFTKLGQISFARGADEDAVMEAALEAGADDVVSNEDGSIDVLTADDQFTEIKGILTTTSLTPEEAEITMRPSTNVSVDVEDAQKMVRLLDMLEELDDVQQVYSNADIAEEILAQLG